MSTGIGRAARPAALAPILALAVLVAATPSARAQSAPEAAAARSRQILAALEYGNLDAARTYMTQDPVVAAQVIAELENPRGAAAKTAYQVRRQALDLAMDDLAKAVHNDPELRGRLLSIEVGGTAGAQERAQRLGDDAPGFTEKYADLDFQFRTTDPESARKVAEHAERILGRVPKEMGIHAFSAMQAPQVATNTRDMVRIQADQFKAAEARRVEKEAASGDAMHATDLDTYNRGVAYEIDPRTGRRSRASIDLDELYDKHGLEPPACTDADAFSVAINEQKKFSGLGEPTAAKRVTRAADALAMADYGAITPEDRQVIDLAAEINRTRDPAAAVGKLPKESPVRADFDRLVAKGVRPADAAATALVPMTRQAQSLLKKAVERSLDAKLADIDRVTALPDAAIVEDLRTRAKGGDPTAERFMEKYERTRRADRAEMVKAARELMVESRKIVLAETFTKMDPEVRTRMASDPRWSGNAHVQNLSALAEVWNDKALAELSGQATNDLRRKGAADGDGPGGAVVPESAFGKALNQFDQAMFWMAMGGTLADAWKKRNEALATEGPEAARAVFAEQVAIKAAGLESSLMAAVAVERLGIVLAEAGFPVFRSVITSVGTGMTVLGIAEVTKAIGNVAWQYAQEPLLRAYLNPTGPISFYQVLKARPETLRADVLTYARDHNLPTGPHATRQVLSAMVKDYFGRAGAPGARMKGMEDRLVDMLVVHEDRSYDYLSRVSDAITRDLVRQKGPAASPAERPAVTRPAVAGPVPAAAAAGDPKDEKDGAAEAARRARERRKARIRDRAEDTGAAKAAKEKTAAEQARDRAAAEDEWRRLQEEGRTENEVRREREAEARVRRENEARLRREAEEARKAGVDRAREDEAGRLRDAESARALQQAEAQRVAAEAEWLPRVLIDLTVPSALQPGGKGTVSVDVRAPQGLNLAGRRVAIRASPGHTDDGSVPLGAGGRGQTVYTAPADYNGYVRVTASFEGYGDVSSTFLVGTPEAEAPPPQKIVNPKPVTLPETADAMAIQVSFSDSYGRGSGRFEVTGGKANGRLEYSGRASIQNTGIKGRNTWTANFGGASYQDGRIRGSGPYSGTIAFDNGARSVGKGTHSTELRLQSGGRMVVVFKVNATTRTTGPGGTATESGSKSWTINGTWSKIARTPRP